MLSVWHVSRGLPCFSTGWVLWRLVYLCQSALCVYIIWKSLWIHLLLLVVASEPVGWLSSKSCPLSVTVFGFQRAEGTRGQTGFSGCDPGCDSSAVKHSITLLWYLLFISDHFVQSLQCYSISCVHCRFRYESNHLLDMSAEEDNELPPVRTLLQVLNTHSHFHLKLQYKKRTGLCAFWHLWQMYIFLCVCVWGGYRMPGKRWSRV